MQVLKPRIQTHIWKNKSSGKEILGYCITQNPQDKETYVGTTSWHVFIPWKMLNYYMAFCTYGLGLSVQSIPLYKTVC